MQILFAKCNDNQHFLISISPSGSLIRLEVKMLTNKHFYSAFYPHQFSESAFSPDPISGI